MRKKKRKQALIFFSIIILIVAVILVCIFLSKIQKVTSGQLNTNYQAGKNVQATLSGGYKIAGGTEQQLTTQDGKSQIVFNTGDSSVPVNQNFNKVENIVLKKDQNFVVRYRIQNNNPNYTLLCDLETEITNSSNIIVEYSINNVNWYENSQVIFGVNGKSIANNKIMYLYIRISIENNTINAKFDGGFNFILSTLD